MSRVDVMALPEFDLSGSRIIITAEWGDGRGHKATDLGSEDGIERGTTVHAPADGWVVSIKDDGPFVPPNGHTAGINIWFLADDDRRWKFFHLNSVEVPANTHVKAGDVIATVGNSGTIAVHLHWEEHVGNWSNPVNNTAAIREAMAAGRWPGALAPPVPAPEPPSAHLSDEDKAFFTTIVNEITRPVVLDDGEGHRSLWEYGLPVTVGDAQVQTVANLQGEARVIPAWPAFVAELRGGVGCVNGEGADVGAIVVGLMEALGEDFAKEVAEAIKGHLAS